MARNRRLHPGGSSGLRSPILKWCPKLRILPRALPAKTEVDMLRRFKSKAPEKDKNAAANATEVIGRMVQQQHSVVEQAVARPPIRGNGLLHRFWHLDRWQDRMHGSSADLWPNRGRVARLAAFDRQWRTGRGQRYCAGRHSLRPRQGHCPWRPRQTAEWWCDGG